MESIQNIENLKNSNLKVALSVLFTNAEVLKMLCSYYPSCSIHQFSCIIGETIALANCYTNKRPINVSSLNKSINQYLQKVEFQNELGIEPGPIDILSAILLNFHCFAVNGICYLNEEAVFSPCIKPCMLHKYFCLEVDEHVACKCGRRWKNSWDKNNICQFYKCQELLEPINEAQSKLIAMLPKYKFKNPDIVGNSSGIHKKMVNQLTYSLEKAKYDHCEIENCPYSEAYPKFCVIKACEFFIIELVDNTQNFNHFESFLMTISITEKFCLKNIYKYGENKDYALQGVVFFGKAYYYANFNGRFWEFPGLHPESGWYEVIQETLVMNLHPVSVIYKAGSQSSIPDLSNYKLLKLEQAAVQCDNFVETYKTSFVPEGYLYSGFFIEKKKGPQNFQIEEEKIPIKRQPDELSSIKSGHFNDDLTNNWECKCGETNKDLFEVCINCSEIKPGLSGWVCKKCCFRNDDVYSFCEACHEFRSRMSESKILDDVEYSGKVEEYKEKNENLPKFDEDQNKKWICSCNCENTSDFEVCQHCYKLKPGVDGWVCFACKAKNEMSDYRCNVCETFKSGNFKPEQQFWVCEKCRSAISAKYNFCDTCMFSGSFDNTDNKYKICKNCHKKFPASAYKCYWCNMDYQDESVSVQVEREIWTCEKCKSKNRYNRYACEYCHENKPEYKTFTETQNECHRCHRTLNPINDKCVYCERSEYSKTLEIAERDLWECQNCKKKNEDWRSFCSACQNEKNKPDNSVSLRFSSDLESWNCSNCSRKNSNNYESVCKFCQTRRNVEKKQRCQICHIQIDEVFCRNCKKIAQISDLRCQVCNSDISKIRICYDCSQGKQESE